MSYRRVHVKSLTIGICEQAPSDYPDEVPPFLVKSRITSISVTPDTILKVRMAVAEAEAELDFLQNQGRRGSPS